ncbi:IS21 family transposase [Enterobacter cloacae]|nr:IS21 family transposase [Enterobacter cloacae]
MPNKRIAMRKTREILRLRFEVGLSFRQISQCADVSTGATQKMLKRLEASGVSWPLPEGMTEPCLASLLYPESDRRPGALEDPDWATTHMELRKKGVTRHLLWEEYCQRMPVRAYSYSQFCCRYHTWSQSQKRSMRQQHLAGEKCFIDYCGPTVPVISAETGEYRQAQIFVAVLGASNYTWAEATYTQSLPDWLLSHVRMLEIFGGVPEILVPDNLKSGVSKACRYDPELNPSYQQLAEHYQVAVIPARHRKPRDKPKVEVGVQIVERWILARLRHQVFFSLAELNHCIRTLVTELNERPFKKLPGNRQEAFERLDKPALRPLLVQPWLYRHIKKAKVNIDYHVEYEQRHYSVPHQHVGKTVELHAFDNLLDIWADGQMITSHPRRLHPGNSTAAEHMPERHRHHQQWTPGRLKNWAAGVGPDTLTWISERLAEKAHPEQAYRLCLGLLSLTREYPSERVNNSCRLANAEGLAQLKQIKSILKTTATWFRRTKICIRGPRHFH